MTRTFSRRGRRAATAVAALAAAALVLGACSSTIDHLKSTASSIASSAASGAGSGGGAAGSLSQALSKLDQSSSSATKATYKASYTATNSDGTTSTITLAQKGSKSAFSSGTNAFYSDGTTSTVCDSSSGTPTCTQVPASSGANPLAGLVGLFNSGTVAAEIHAAAAAAGVSVSQSTETHGGLSSSCFSYAKAGQTFKFCFSTAGIVTYISSPSGTSS